MVILFSLLTAAAAINSFHSIESWAFQDESTCHTWQANQHFTAVTCEEGILKAQAIDWDPFFTCSNLNIPTKATQYVSLRLRASSGGKGQLFWTGATGGVYGGFDAGKVTDFEVRGGEFEEIFIFPYWQTEGTICQLRLDLYEGATFEIASIAILEEKPAPAQTGENLHWDLNSELDTTGWHRLNMDRILVAPPLDIALDTLGWVSLKARSREDTTISLYWSTTAMAGSRHETVCLRGGDVARHYHIELQGYPQWTGSLVGMYFSFTDPDKVIIERVTLAELPEGPPELEVSYLGLENGVSRAGRGESLLAQFTNRGGGAITPGTLRLELPDGIQVLEGPVYDSANDLLHGDMSEARWTVKAESAAGYAVTLFSESLSTPGKATLVFEPSVTLSAEYVPEPRPITTSQDILAYYFPGWDASPKWDCIRDTAPIRRPLLGYYDEANVECVDWQIKWAVENGISCFLVDWYWTAGHQGLLHWFDAYRRARYRNMLKVAIMWANHNPPGTHSREDWRAVTREWVDRYFTLDSYYHINGRPAVFIWDANTIRKDLGGSIEVAAAFADSQEMARTAGHEGITFIVLQHHITEGDMKLLLEEGYAGHTSYHEWGEAYDLAPATSQGKFADIVSTTPASWEKRRNLSDQMQYIPVVDTGWDSRPWHGSNATAFHGRSVEGFRTLLQSARAYCEQHKTSTIILGPLNEWGEGSYIEPNLEFGFKMYEAIREIFGQGDARDWPENISPRDIGLGPYDFPQAPLSYTWDFEDGLQGWAAMMNIAGLRVENGLMCFETASQDPALIVATSGLQTSRYGRLHIRMKVAGKLPEGSSAQVFWTVGSGGTSEAGSLHFPLQNDGEFHDYCLDLNAHPRWRGRISTLRFDPCDFGDAQVCLDSFIFAK